MYSNIESALNDLKQGKMILVADDKNRENEVDIVIASEDINAAAINFMATYGRGLICATITQERASELNLLPMVARNTDAHETAFTVSVDSVNTTTGISAYDRADTIKQLVIANSASMFRQPGHIFPLIGKEGGVLVRTGHTEASIDLARLAGKFASATICEVMGDDGKMITGKQVEQFAQTHNLTLITIEDLIDYRKKHEQLLTLNAKAQMPTKYGQFSIVGFTEKWTGKEHIALVKGDVSNKEDVLVRIHSECLTGDSFASLKCDCGQQLEQSLKAIETAGAGIVIYLKQEGRGIGLINKIKAYSLQDQGLDTVEANHALGFADDIREYYAAKQILSLLNVNSIKLMTNNPQKVSALEHLGVSIKERVDCRVLANDKNKQYLQIKKEKMNHYL